VRPIASHLDGPINDQAIDIIIQIDGIQRFDHD
jgi:hypothetical protein